MKTNSPLVRVGRSSPGTSAWLHARNAGHNSFGIILLACLLLSLAGCASDSVGDRREGQLIVCHKGSKTLAVSNADSFLHLDHGDALGPCAEEQ